jgi:cell fate regulator YaaT (PSP1 superfamily)
MACGSCGVSKDGKPSGCNGSCSGGCNRMNSYDWLSVNEIVDVIQYDIVEIMFNQGRRKDFYKNPDPNNYITGDKVIVEVPNGGGYDLGTISLCGELVKLQMKKKKVDLNDITLAISRKANERDLEKLIEARSQEKEVMIKARVISRSLKVDMKVGDVEFQADKRKITFYYTAEGRVDFRELIKEFAKEFKVKIEMRQIGSRQESALIGGIGSCGRELCCSTWLTDFKSVSTAAARYQNLSINQTKLSGQCGRLKCCLNYELDTYLDALQHFPDHADRIKTESGNAVLIKTDVFKGLFYYVIDEGPDKGKFYTLEINQVKEILEKNKKGIKYGDIKGMAASNKEDKRQDEEPEVDYEDVTGAIELKDDKKRKKKKKKKPFGNNKNNNVQQ